MPDKLTFTLIPRERRREGYDWMNVDCAGARVGKVRGRIDGGCVTINSVNIFPEFERLGYGTQVVEMFKATFDTITADRVRPTAIGFWKKMDFRDSQDGNYRWKKRTEKNAKGGEQHEDIDSRG